MAACLASILEARQDTIPPLDTGNNLEEMESVLAMRGMGFCWLVGDMTGFKVPSWCLPHVILVGGSPRNPQFGHAVVADVTETGLVVSHDPHSSRQGIRKPWRGVITLFTLSDFKRYALGE